MKLPPRWDWLPWVLAGVVLGPLCVLGAVLVAAWL